MEGLIPYLYKTIVQHKDRNQGGTIELWLNGSSSPSPSYVRLPSGDSGRFQPSSSTNLSESSTKATTGPRSPNSCYVAHQEINVQESQGVMMH
ncbi:hypothetical protein vseg_020587 [Gypsophila vaccaria]